MAGSPQVRRTGNESYNGFDINLYGFLPQHLILKDYEASSLEVASFWDATNSRQELVGQSGETLYTYTTLEVPNPLTIAVFSGPQILADDGSGVLKDQNGTARGSVNYTTGSVGLTFELSAAYPVYITYSTGVAEGEPWNGDVFNRLAEAPVIQKTFWAVELDAMELLDTIESLPDLSFVDTVSEENIQYNFDEWGFDSQVYELDIAKSRQWLREMSSMWKMKNSYRMWIRLLENLGIDSELYVLYKKHPLNNYGENDNEIYSRNLDAISLTAQRNYEKLLKANGNDPVGVDNPSTGDAHSAIVCKGDGSTYATIQFPVIQYPPEWSTVVIRHYTLSAGYLSWAFTLNTTTGYVEVHTTTGFPVGLGKGYIDLTTGKGYIDFRKDLANPDIHIPSDTIIAPESTFVAAYTVIGTSYQAARVDLTVNLSDTPGYASGDRAADTVERVIEYVRPIHVLIRQLSYRVSEEESAVMSEATCCGPNVVRATEYAYPVYSKSQSSFAASGQTIYGGSVINPPIVRGTFNITDGINQSATSDYSGNLVHDTTGDTVGYIEFMSGMYWVEFPAVTGAVPTITYDTYDATVTSPEIDVNYLGDGSSIAEKAFDRSSLDLSISYASEDIDSEYKNLITGLVTQTPTTDSSITGTYASQNIFKGVTSVYPVVPNTFVVTVAVTGETMLDDSHGNIIGTAGSGTIDYLTGVYILYINAGVAKSTISVPVFTDGGSGQDDMTIDTSAVYVGESDKSYVVEIDGAAIPDTFRWSNDGGATWEYSTVSITAGAIPLEDGVVITFAGTTGHAVGDKWEFSTMSSITFDIDFNVLDTGDTEYTGGLHANLTPGSVVIKDVYTGQVVTDDGIGGLIGDIGALGTNTIDYVLGTYDFSFLDPAPALATNGIEVYATYSFTSVAAHVASAEDINYTIEDSAYMSDDLLYIVTSDASTIPPTITELYR